MALSKIQPASMDLTANYAFTGTNSISTIDYEETKLATLTASSSSSLDFTSNIDSTYNIYKFRFINIHPSNNATRLQYNLSVDGGSNYNVAKTTHSFKAYHNEAGNTAALAYETGTDLAQGTGTQFIGDDISNANDANMCGQMFLFDPSSTTFVKHVLIQTATLSNGDFAVFNTTGSGYGNTTSAVNAVQFTMSSGTIDSGTIEMYGIN
jgi:hypothetical protein|tara:strand:+ start:1114 stop:1740 length:627 start_codon:yes stop_codon:yes gene_type:complete